jgi:hypothetical protein
MSDFDPLSFDEALSRAAEPRIDPLWLDRSIARSAAWWDNFLAGLREPDGIAEVSLGVDPNVSGLKIFTALGNQLSEDPPFVPFRRWVYRLADQRINEETLRLVAARYRIETHQAPGSEVGQKSLAELWQRALSRPAERDAFIDSYLRAVRPLAESVAHLWERKAELAQRMGGVDLAALVDRHVSLANEAETWLAETADLAELSGTRPFAGWLSTALGTPAGENWPRHLSVRSLAEFFREGQLLDDVRLPRLELPTPVGPSSFLRGFESFGRAHALALAPRDQPFVVARDPYGLQEQVAGAMFACLPGQRTFATRHLDVDRNRWIDFRRSMARVVLWQSRARAVSLLLREAALSGRSALRETFEGLLPNALGTTLPKEAAGTLFAPRDDSGQRLAALWLAAFTQARYVKAHDEDWFRNPRAEEEWRSDVSRPPAFEISPSELTQGRALLLAWLQDNLD